MIAAELIMKYLVVVVFVSIFIFLGAALHMAYTKMDRLLEYLSNSPVIMVRAPLKNGGPWGRILLLGAISGVIIFQKSCLKRGVLCPDDLKRIPASLKGKLIAMYWASAILMAGMLSILIVEKSGLLE